jgi:hypothetical protein
LPSFLQLICSYRFLSIRIGTAKGGAHAVPLRSVQSRMPIRPAHRVATLLICIICSATRLDGQDTTTVERTPPPAKPSPMLYITPFLSAGWSQRLGTPKAWKRTWGGYGSRVGDQFGSLVVRESVRRLVDHAVPWVDDRSPCLSHPVSPAREVVVRTGCAIARTSTLRTTSGELRPNLPFLTGIAVGSATSLSWRPERHSAASSRAFVAQRLAISYGATVLVRLVKDWRADAKARP